MPWPLGHPLVHGGPASTSASRAHAALGGRVGWAGLPGRLGPAAHQGWLARQPRAHGRRSRRPFPPPCAPPLGAARVAQRGSRLHRRTRGLRARAALRHPGPGAGRGCRRSRRRGLRRPDAAPDTPARQHPGPSAGHGRVPRRARRGPGGNPRGRRPRARSDPRLPALLRRAVGRAAGVVAAPAVVGAGNPVGRAAAARRALLLHTSRLPPGEHPLVPGSAVRGRGLDERVLGARRGRYGPHALEHRPDLWPRRRRGVPASPPFAGRGGLRRPVLLGRRDRARPRAGDRAQRVSGGPPHPRSGPASGSSRRGP